MNEGQKEALALIRNRLNASMQSGAPVPLEEAFKTVEQIHQQQMELNKKEGVALERKAINNL